VPTPEYPVPDAPNVLRIPFALTPHRAREVEQSDRQLLSAYPRPRHLLLIGGPTLYWQLPGEEIEAAVRYLQDTASKSGGSVLAVGSPRTPADLLGSVRQALEASPVPFLFEPGDGPPAFPAVIDAADDIFVTADSVAMVADALSTGKPVGLIPIEKSRFGRVITAVMDHIRPGRRLYPRDLRFFWAALDELGYCGTLESPKASEPLDYPQLVAERVRQLLEQPPPAIGARDSGR
jgi:hypothetical protein